MQHKYKRILVVGSGGAGKSTLSRELGKQWDLPVVHLDSLYWNPGWSPTPRPEFLKKVKQELSKPAWIMDGNFDSTFEFRANHADLIIFLDYSNIICLYRACKRAWVYRGTTRPDMGEGCPEKIDWEFVRWIWRYPKDAKPRMLELMSKADPEVLVLASPRETQRWLQKQKQIEAEHP